MASAPYGILSTPGIIERFQNAEVQPGQKSPLPEYFSTLLDHGRLNETESFQLDLAFTTANSNNPFEAEHLAVCKFNDLFQDGSYTTAAKVDEFKRFSRSFKIHINSLSQIVL